MYVKLTNSLRLFRARVRWQTSTLRCYGLGTANQRAPTLADLSTLSFHSPAPANREGSLHWLFLHGISVCALTAQAPYAGSPLTTRAVARKGLVACSI